MRQFPLFILCLLVLLLLWFHPLATYLVGKLTIVTISAGVGFWFGTYAAKLKIAPSWTPKEHLNFLLRVLRVK